MSGAALVSRMYERIRSSSSARSRASSAWVVAPARCGSSTHAHQRERKCGRSRPVFHATEQHPGQGHPPGVRRAGALIPRGGLSSTGGLSSAPLSTASAPGGNVAVLDMLTVT